MANNQEAANISNIQSERIARAQGCLIGQLTGEARGKLEQGELPR